MWADILDIRGISFNLGGYNEIWWRSRTQVFLQRALFWIMWPNNMPSGTWSPGRQMSGIFVEN